LAAGRLTIDVPPKIAGGNASPEVAHFGRLLSLESEWCGNQGNPKRQRGTTPEEANTNANAIRAYASGFLAAIRATLKK
jgi:hypothetical protein